MAPRRRISPETNLRDPGLRPVASPTGGFNDVSNLLRYQNQFRNVIDFTDLSSTLNRAVGYLGEVKAEQDRLSTEGGDLAGAVIEKSLKNNYKTYNEMIDSLTPEQRTALSALGPVQTRIFAEQVSKHTVSNLESKMAAAIKGLSEQPLTDSNGNIIPPPDIAGRVAEVYSESINEYDQMYNDVPLIRNGVRNLAGSALSTYQAKALMVEGEIRANHNEAVYTSNGIKMALTEASHLDTPDKVDAFVDKFSSYIFDNGQSANLKGDAKRAYTERVSQFAIALANDGHYDEAVQLAYTSFDKNEDKGYSLNMTQPEALGKILSQIKGIKNIQDEKYAGISKLADKDENKSAYRAYIMNAAYTDPNLTATSLQQKAMEDAQAGKIPGITPQMVVYYNGTREFNMIDVGQTIQSIKAMKGIPEVDDYFTAYTEASSTMTSASIDKAMQAALKVSNPQSRGAFIANVEKLKADKFKAEQTTIRSPLNIDPKQVDLINRGRFNTFFDTIHPDLVEVSDRSLREAAGQKYASIYNGYENEIALVRKDESMKPLDKEIKVREIKSKYEKEWTNLDDQVTAYRTQARTKIEGEGVNLYKEFENSKDSQTKSLNASKIRSWLERYSKFSSPADAIDLLEEGFKNNPTLAVAFHRADNKNTIIAIESAVRERIAVITNEREDERNQTPLGELVEEFRKEHPNDPFVKGLDGFDLSNEQGIFNFATSPEFAGFLPKDGAILRNPVTYIKTLQDAVSAFSKSTPISVQQPAAIEGQTPKAPESKPAKNQPNISMALEESNDERGVYAAYKRLNLEQVRYHDKDAFSPLRGESTFYGFDTLKYPSTFMGKSLSESALAPTSSWTTSGGVKVGSKFNRDIAADALLKSIQITSIPKLEKPTFEVDGGRVGPFGMVMKGLTPDFIEDRKPTPLDIAVFGENTFSRNLDIGSEEYRKVLFVRHTFGKEGVSFKPLTDAFRQQFPDPSPSVSHEMFTFMGIPSTAFNDGTFDSLLSDQKTSLVDTHHGSDWNDFKTMWELDKPIVVDDVRIDRFEKLSGISVKDSALVGKSLKDFNSFLLYAQRQHKKHLNLNGRSTPKEFELNSVAASRPAR